MSASHNVGGYFNYECNGLVGANLDSVEYTVEFRFYRDTALNPGGGSPPPITTELPVTIFDVNNQLVGVVRIPQITLTMVPDNISNPCVVDAPDLEIEEGYFRGTIRLATNRSHQLVYQICCRSEEIDNLSFANPIIAPDFYGNTYQIDIPSFDAVGCNSSPKFIQEPPLVLCFDIDVKDIGLNLTAIDTVDNDSLVYSLCAPLDFNRNDAIPVAPPGNRFAPDTANFPPYNFVPFGFGRSATDPIPSNPSIVIDSKTGAISGVPSRNFEDYTVGICVEEYRRGTGQLMSVTRRDIQISTGNCNPVIVSAVQDQQQFCDGLKVKFINNSNAPQNGVDIQGYKWDFGVPGIDSDTSREREPEFTFPSEGVYTITLIANPDIPCSDTSVQIFEVFPLLNPTIETDGSFCADNNSIDFSVGGTFKTTASFAWDFGSLASIPSSTMEVVNGVSFSGASSFPVELTVRQDNCEETISTTINTSENPTISFTLSDSAGCYPFPVTFTNSSTSVGITEFEWDFGDGTTSTDRDPVHTYTENGKYDVSLELRTTEGCIDTLVLVKPEAVDISLDSANNVIDFDIVPPEGCAPFRVDFVDKSTFDGVAQYFWDFGDGKISFDANTTNVYSDTGSYSIGLLVITSGKCVDTLIKTFDDTIRVLPVPISEVTRSDSTKPLKEALFQFDGRGSEFAEKSKFLINGREIDTVKFLNYQFQDTGHFTIDYIAFNEFGCSDTSSTEVFIFDEFEFLIPNVFSPNNDGINESFKIRACGVYDYNISIFNRFGEEVFKSNSLNINWDGTVSGRNANSGIYYYTIRIKDFRGEFINYTGTVTVITD